MSFIDTILSRIAPYDCLSCYTEGDLLCDDCLKGIMVNNEECYRCRQPSAASLTCDACLGSSGVYRAMTATVYEKSAKDLIWRLKSSGAQSAAKTMASALLPFVDSKEGYLLVPAPTATNRVRQRGYDQSRLLARQLSRLSGLPWADCLVRNGQAHQVGADRELRLDQLNNAFTIKNASLLQGSYILIIDDVITTGATAERAAAALLDAGATRVEALAFSRPTLIIQ